MILGSEPGSLALELASSKGRFAKVIRGSSVGNMGAEAYNFGTATYLEADAVGPPGQRRFRLLAHSAQGTVWLWLEREQLQALSMAIDELLGGMPALWSLQRATAKPVPRAMLPASKPALEVQVGQLGLGYDEERKLYVIQAHDIEADVEGAPTFVAWATRQQLETLTRQIGEVLAAGRPRCPLCHQPLSPGQPHSCPGHNGHGQTEE